MMKSLRTLLLAGVMTFSLAGFAQNIVSENNIDITINGETTREELAAYAQQMKNLGITFLYKPQFDGNRKLVLIEYTLTSNGTTLGTVTSPNLKMNGNKSRFHLVKTNGVFTASCLGTCQD